MNKELCFFIENKELYLEQVLVDYNDVPIFFLCRNEEQFYIALCTDLEELSYIVEKLSSVDVYKLLHGKSTMRDTLLSHEEYWEIISGEEISLDKVIKRTIDCMDRSVLPEENAYFQILTEEARLYVEAFDKEYLSNENFHVSDEKLDFNERLTDDLFVMLGGWFGDFTDLGGCSIYTQVKQFVSTVADSKEIYRQSEVKTAILTGCNGIENKYSDDIISMAA